MKRGDTDKRRWAQMNMDEIGGSLDGAGVYFKVSFLG